MTTDADRVLQDNRRRHLSSGIRGWHIPVVALVVLIGVAEVHLTAEEGAVEPVVLLTAFKPFVGRGLNGSETVAKALDQRLIAGARVHVLILPVHWGEPERQLPLAVAKWKPVLLLGLGEGLPGHVALERVARNHAAHPDEASVPAPAILDSSGPATRAARLICDLSWFTATRVPVRLSDDAGDFLCNSLLYTALAQPVAHAGFVHLPPQGGVAGQDYVEPLLPIVVTVIERNLAR